MRPLAAGAWHARNQSGSEHIRVFAVPINYGVEAGHLALMELSYEVCMYVDREHVCLLQNSMMEYPAQ